MNGASAEPLQKSISRPAAAGTPRWRNPHFFWLAQKFRKLFDDSQSFTAPDVGHAFHKRRATSALPAALRWTGSASQVKRLPARLQVRCQVTSGTPSLALTASFDASTLLWFVTAFHPGSEEKSALLDAVAARGLAKCLNRRPYTASGSLCCCALKEGLAAGPPE